MKFRLVCGRDRRVSAAPAVMLALVLLIPLGPVLAKDVDQDEAYRLRQEGKIQPLETVLHKAKRRHPGKVIEIELERKKGRLLYEIEVLDKQGVVWEMKFDAETGSLVKDEKDN